MNIFGFEIGRKKGDRPEEEGLSTFNLSRDITGDAGITTAYHGLDYGAHSIYGWDVHGLPTTEYELIRNYRELASAAEVDEALQEIRNEVFITDVPDKKAFEINWKQDSKVSRRIQKLIEAEFDYLYDLIDFDTQGVQLFDDWYVDSKLYLHKVIDRSNPRRGILRIEPIDPMKIRKYRILPKPNPDGSFNLDEIVEMYVYRMFNPEMNPMGVPIEVQMGTSIEGIQISPDSITYVNSGKYNRQLGLYEGYLRKAIIPYNNMRMMEEAMIIFRVVRAPARRAIYIDVSGVQKSKAEAYMKDLMSKFRNKMVYDTKTGKLSDRRAIATMQEDYWLPRRDGGKGTEIQTLEGQSSQEIMDELEYLRDKLWRALGVPRGRFGDQSSTFIFGKGIEIQRDEYRFTKFLSLLRGHFLRFMLDLLKTQCLLKKITDPKDWVEIEKDIGWTFTEDNAFVEYKEAEILNNRLSLLASAEPYIGKYFSRRWAKVNILRQTEKEIEEEQSQIDDEAPQEMELQDPFGEKRAKAGNEFGVRVNRNQPSGRQPSSEQGTEPLFPQESDME